MRCIFAVVRHCLCCSFLCFLDFLGGCISHFSKLWSLDVLFELESGVTKEKPSTGCLLL